MKLAMRGSNVTPDVRLPSLQGLWLGWVYPPAQGPGFQLPSPPLRSERDRKSTPCSLCRQEKDREVEMRGVTAALDKAREQISDATWREGLALEKVRSQPSGTPAPGAAP